MSGLLSLKKSKTLPIRGFSLGEYHLASLRQGTMTERNALEHHDSLPEEQARAGLGCDLDHLNAGVEGGAGAIPKTGG
jgi:hypothetical protein